MSPEAQRDIWQRWHNAMELSHEMLMARLRSELKEGEDIWDAYRNWYDRYQEAKWSELSERQTAQNSKVDSTDAT